MKYPEPKEVIFFENKKGKRPFVDWIDNLDSITRARINQRILRVSLGNYGDYKVLKDGVSELRFIFGAGYRVYFAEDGNKIVVLLSGGDKKTQSKDIAKAIEYWEEYKEEKDG